MADCLFCKMVRREISSEIIREDEHTLAFLDIRPRAPGHAMVIPKVHAPHLTDLPDAEIGPLFTAVKAVALRLTEILKPDGMTIGMNQGEASGQVVGHLHVHLLPRYDGDGGGAIQSVVGNPGPEVPAEIAKRLRVGI